MAARIQPVFRILIHIGEIGGAAHVVTHVVAVIHDFVHPFVCACRRDRKVADDDVEAVRLIRLSVHVVFPEASEVVAAAVGRGGGVGVPVVCECRVLVIELGA
ncbi:hypothetical protein D3C84_1077320 [compost metagenome]